MLGWVITAIVAAIVIIAVWLLIKRLRESGFGRSYSDRNRGEGPRFPLTKIVVPIVIVILILIAVVNSVAVVPAGHRGVLVSWGGRVETVNLPEGITFKTPFVQDVTPVSVMIQKAEVEESTASRDLQEITTKLAVHYKIKEDSAWRVYQTMRNDYLHLLVEPVIMEELKATTADWTAEQLITDRPLVVIALTDKLNQRLTEFGIVVLTVNIIDFQFSKEFWDAIERKVVAQQDALTEKNKVEIERFKQLQAIISAQGQYNVTVIRANAEAMKKILEANGTATAIRLVTEQMTPEYALYLWLNQWDGRLPMVIAGNQTAYILDISKMISDTNATTK